MIIPPPEHTAKLIEEDTEILAALSQVSDPCPCSVPSASHCSAPTETRFRHAIRAENFSMFEMCGFRDNPTAALIAGAAIGYKMACQDVQNDNGEPSTHRKGE